MTAWLRRAAPAAALAFVALLLAGCDDGPGAGAAQEGGGGERPPQPVAVVTVQEEAIPLVNELPGRIAPTRIAEVRPRVAGIVTERVFKQGSEVAEGDVLYRIDPERFRVQVERARATVTRAEAQRRAAEQAADRQEALRERNVVSAQAYDDAIAALAVANASVAVAEAELAAAELDLRHAEVRAPIAGRIGRARITEGALVTASGAESLATIQQLDPVYADFTQPARALMALRRAWKSGELERSADGAATVQLRFDDGSGYAHDGRLLFSEATVDATTGQVTLRAAFPNPEGDLLPGMYVRVLIEQGVEPRALAVPKQAVQRGPGGEPWLLIVDGEDVARRRGVAIGRAVDGRWVIEEGLAPGDRVIVEGFQKIRPDAPVAPEPWGAEPRAEAGDAPAEAG
ncbi:MAG: efflux RND transporter periplasmic adaptor subunit [Pseudomonadota bacterium]